MGIYFFNFSFLEFKIGLYVYGILGVYIDFIFWKEIRDFVLNWDKVFLKELLE